MSRNWEEGDEVVVNYPRNGSRRGTLVQKTKYGTWMVLFSDADDGGQPEADPQVPEPWLEVPGQFFNLSNAA